MAESFRAVPQGVDLPRSAGWLSISAREWRLHGVLFLLTIVTTTLAGMLFVGVPALPPYDPPLTGPLDYVLYIPLGYAHTILAVVRMGFTEPRLFAQGATFSASLLAILFSHEMGHYLACRYYKVDATLPYFIPAPPIFLAGTFGAFIKIRSPIPSRRALFDIGLAGPLAGFVVAVPLSVIGVLTMGPPQPPPADGAIFFNDPLLFRLIAKVMGVPLDPNALPNPYYMAAWIGLLVTSLNLMPVGQLDGGHSTFALFGSRAHRLIAKVAFLSTAVLAILGFYWHHSPSGFLYTVLLAVMLRVPHPAPAVLEPLGAKRILIAILSLLVFILCFWPFPITIT
jgi:membrane-associated protease RseP (regulator of RpoE activity)